MLACEHIMVIRCMRMYNNNTVGSGADAASASSAGSGVGGTGGGGGGGTGGTGTGPPLHHSFGIRVFCFSAKTIIVIICKYNLS